jgi:hypothetical protein
MDSMVVFSFCGGAVSKFEFIYPCRIELRIAVGGWNIFPSSRLTNCSRLFVCLFFGKEVDSAVFLLHFAQKGLGSWVFLVRNSTSCDHHWGSCIETNSTTRLLQTAVGLQILWIIPCFKMWCHLRLSWKRLPPSTPKYSNTVLPSKFQTCRF